MIEQVNELSEYCEVFRLCPVKTMNLLQEWGVCADECVSTEDVAPSEMLTSVNFVKLNKSDLHAG